jgi:hypothetical protein
MPTVSNKQKRFMQAVANNEEFAKKVDVPQSVGKEMVEEDNRFSAKALESKKDSDWMDSPRWSKLKKKLGK